MQTKNFSRRSCRYAIEEMKKQSYYKYYYSDVVPVYKGPLMTISLICGEDVIVIRIVHVVKGRSGGQQDQWADACYSLEKWGPVLRPPVSLPLIKENS